MALTGQQLLDYACRQFENGAYDAALEAFILSYTKEYEQEWVLENIYNCYMAGNEAGFQKNYELWRTGGKPAYEDLTLDFIPYREGEYYIFDREIQNFRGIFSIDSVNNSEREEDFRQMEFSALALAMYWDWGSLPGILAEAKFHKIYAVCQDMNKCASFFKIPELAEYAKNIMLFSTMEEFQSYFHEHTAVYLPKLCIGTEDGKKELLDIINREHAYRLTPEGRNTDNVLLTIGIPTHDRGNLLLKRLENLRDMPYDAEIEFAISKNGTHYYQEEYQSVSLIDDARINYMGYNEELWISKNWQNVIEMAHGKFVVLLSDEDDVIVSALEHYLAFLNTHTGLALVRPRTAKQYYTIKSSVYYKKGTEAFFGGWIKQNYLSGSIYNRKLFLEANFEFWDEHYADNEFYCRYPHGWWQAVLAFEGDYAEDAVFFIQEGDSAHYEQMQQYKKDNILDEVGNTEEDTDIILSPSTYEGRIEQFKGAAELIWNYNKMDSVVKIQALMALITKTLYLMQMVYEVYSYKPEMFPLELEHLVAEVMAVMEQWKLAEGSRNMILTTIYVYIKDMEK